MSLLLGWALAFGGAYLLGRYDDPWTGAAGVMSIFVGGTVVGAALFV